MPYFLSEAQIEQIPNLLREEDGNIAAAARRLGITRKSLWDRVQASEELTAIVNELKETFLDNVEGNIRKFAMGNSKAALTAGIFTLKTLGKSRGYVERVEQETVSFEEIERAIENMNADQKAEARKRIKAGESSIAVCREIAGRE